MQNKNGSSLSVQAFKLFLYALGLALFIVFGVRAIRQATSMEAVKGKPSLQIGVDPSGHLRLGLVSSSQGFENSLEVANALRTTNDRGSSKTATIPPASSSQGSLEGSSEKPSKTSSDGQEPRPAPVAPGSTSTASDSPTAHDSTNASLKANPPGQENPPAKAQKD